MYFDSQSGMCCGWLRHAASMKYLSWVIWESMMQVQWSVWCRWTVRRYDRRERGQKLSLGQEKETSKQANRMAAGDTREWSEEPKQEQLVWNNNNSSGWEKWIYNRQIHKREIHRQTGIRSLSLSGFSRVCSHVSAQSFLSSKKKPASLSRLTISHSSYVQITFTRHSLPLLLSCFHFLTSLCHPSYFSVHSTYLCISLTPNQFSALPLLSSLCLPLYPPSHLIAALLGSRFSRALYGLEVCSLHVQFAFARQTQQDSRRTQKETCGMSSGEKWE